MGEQWWSIEKELVQLAVSEIMIGLLRSYSFYRAMQCIGAYIARAMSQGVCLPVYV